MLVPYLSPGPGSTLVNLKKGPIMANPLSALCGDIDIDIATADAFRSELFDLIDQCDLPTVHVDLAAVTFMDSQGYHALADAHEYASRRHRVMVIQNLTEQCARVIRLCDRDNELHVETLISEPHTEELPPHIEGANTENFGSALQRGIWSSSKPVRTRSIDQSLGFDRSTSRPRVGVAARLARNSPALTTPL